MGRTLRLIEGRFGRLVLNELAAQDRIEAQADPVIVLQQRYDGVLFLNPGEAHVTPGPTRVLVLHAASGWLRSAFPAAFEGAMPPGTTTLNEGLTAKPPRESAGQDARQPLR